MPESPITVALRILNNENESDDAVLVAHYVIQNEEPYASMWETYESALEDNGG